MNYKEHCTRQGFAQCIDGAATALFLGRAPMLFGATKKDASDADVALVNREVRMDLVNIRKHNVARLVVDRYSVARKT